jgi:tRNA A-37 threonylcarbamoyl transferase component Bud32
VPLRRLAHGYTNETWVSGTTVCKRYLGLDAEDRMRRELAAVEAVGTAVPAPRVLSVDRVRRLVEFARVEGEPGQALIERGLAVRVLKATGRTLAGLHSLSDRPVTHGDYGPHNLLLDPSGDTVVLVADWEFATAGSEPITDLAWAEWIVRMHHPGRPAGVDALYDGYGHTPPWADRRRAMRDRCEALRSRCAAAGDADADGCGQPGWSPPRAGTAKTPSTTEHRRSLRRVKVMVLGSGAREHALLLALSRDPSVTGLVCAPGNAGTAALAESRAVETTDGEAVVALAR